MTATTEDASTTEPAEAAAAETTSTGDSEELPPGQWPRHLRTAAPEETLRRGRRLLVIALALLVVVGAGLVAAGLDLVWTSTGGRYIEPGLQPDDPNYIAMVEPTPTLLVISVHEDELVGVALLALRPRDEGGSVIAVPAQTRISDLDEEVETLADAYATDGGSGVAGGIESLVGVAVTDTFEVNDEGWASQIGPVEPLTVVVPDDVGDLWPAGPVDLAGDEVGEFLRAKGDDESELNRLARQELFWRAWISAVATEGESAVPGESDRSLGRFIDGLRQDLAAVSSIPLVVRSGEGDEGEYFEADEAEVAAIVARDIPYPQEPEIGARTRVSLLNGTSETDLGVRATGPLVEAGAEIAMTGNAATFDEPQTVLAYSDASQRQAAVELRNALGIGEIEHRSSAAGPSVVDEGERIDVTVILGADAPEAIRRLESTG